VVARRESDHARFAFLLRQLEKPIGRPAKLEGVARLETFAFQPDLGARDLALDERRVLNQLADALGRLNDVGAGDFS
jgi:hypothetical protein